MIEIEEPPNTNGCASCASVLVWLWSARKKAWVAFVPDPLDPTVLRVHGCAHAQDRATWRELPHGDPPSDEYREIKEQLTKGTT